MDAESISEVAREIEPLLRGRSPGKIFQLAPTVLAIDFGLREQGFLFISVEPADARLHLIKRRVRDLEKQGHSLNQFSLALRKELSGSRVISVNADTSDRIVRFKFSGQDELGSPVSRTLVAQVTGRSANLLLLDAHGTVIHTLRPIHVAGQRPGDSYATPQAAKSAAKAEPDELLALIRSRRFTSASEAADFFYTKLAEEKQRATRLAAARNALRKKISQQRKLLKQLGADLQSHANAEEDKHIGDLLLANISTAKRDGNRLTLIDYFSNDAATVEIDLDQSISLPQEAARRFARYSRSKRATTQIAQRMKLASEKLQRLQKEEQLLAQNETIANALLESRTVLPSGTGTRETKAARRIPGTRRYVSADNLEILVGRTAQDNDHLTSKIAQPNDLWLHAADFGGSHVVVRTVNRKPVPHQTLIEAAQLAAFFSQAKKEAKVDVHYTERKFVLKIKGGKPGLVRLQRFKNITVEPKEAGTKS